MHHGTYAVKQTGPMWNTDLGSNLYFGRFKGLVNLKFSNVQWFNNQF